MPTTREQHERISPNDGSAGAGSHRLPVLLRVPDSNFAPVIPKTSRANQTGKTFVEPSETIGRTDRLARITRIMPVLNRLPNNWVKRMASRVMIVGIALCSFGLIYFMLHGPSKLAHKDKEISRIPTPITPTINGNSSGGTSPIIGTALSPLTKQEPVPSPGSVQPIRSVPSNDPGPVLGKPNGDESANRPATLNGVARGESATNREIFSWGTAQFDGTIIKFPQSENASTIKPGQLK